MNTIYSTEKEKAASTPQSQVGEIIGWLKGEVEAVACHARTLRERLSPVLKLSLPSDSCDKLQEKPALVPLAQELEDITNSIRAIKTVHTDILERIEL